MRHTHGDGALVLVLLAGFVACADPVSRTVAPSPSRDSASEPAPAPVSAERAALNKIAQLVAEALDNEPARQHLKRDMRATLFREHKLQLTAYLQSKDGKSLLQRMAALNGGDEDAIFTTLAQVRPLEFYMPVAKHREAGKGKESVLVGTQLEQATPTTAYEQRGRGGTAASELTHSQRRPSISPG